MDISIWHMIDVSFFFLFLSYRCPRSTREPIWQQSNEEWKYVKLFCTPYMALHFINLRKVMFVWVFFNFFQILVGRYPGAQLGVGKLSSEWIFTHLYDVKKNSNNNKKVLQSTSLLNFSLMTIKLGPLNFIEW